MNCLEKEMLDTLKNLSDNYGVIELKAEYENEGSRQVELMRLKDIADHADLPIILKIGGVEAVTDMYEALSIGVKGIIAPMAETSYALFKYLEAVEKFIPEDNREDIQFAVNIETIDAWGSFEDMMKLDNIDVLNGVTFGRVDFVGSLGEDREFVDSEDILRYCMDIFSQAKVCDLKTALGGAISAESEEFIRILDDAGLIDKYETRKVVYSMDGLKNYQKGIQEGIRFELQWLKSKRRYYHRITNEDEKRIKMLEERIK